MWVIGMALCMGLLLVGHAFVRTGHGSHRHEDAAPSAVTPATAPSDPTAGTPCEGAAQPEESCRHP